MESEALRAVAELDVSWNAHLECISNDVHKLRTMVTGTVHLIYQSFFLRN